MSSAFSDMRTDPDRWLWLPLLGLLVLAFLTGGGSMDRGWGDASTQLLALAVLLVAALRVTAAPPPPAGWGGLALAVSVPVWLAVQTWGGLSKWPWATERSLWATMPGVAAFLAGMSLSPRDQQRAAVWVVGLVTVSVVLGFLQLGAPQDSLLNPFPQWPPSLGGLFANPNHQATFITVALVWVVSWLLQVWQSEGSTAGSSEAAFARVLAKAGGALVLLAVLPLTGSRAMVLVAVGAVALLALLDGRLLRHARKKGRRRRAALGLLLVLVIAAGLVMVVSGWIRTGHDQDLRGPIADATVAMARDSFPTGVGVGNFVPWFQGHAPRELQLHGYINHAHNEYAQWALESGVFSLLWMALLTVWLAWTMPRGGVEGVRPSALGLASWLSVVVVLAHGAVDYPLRTPAGLVVTALMAGIATHAALHRSNHLRKREKSATWDS